MLLLSLLITKQGPQEIWNRFCKQKKIPQRKFFNNRGILQCAIQKFLNIKCTLHNPKTRAYFTNVNEQGLTQGRNFFQPFLNISLPSMDKFGCQKITRWAQNRAKSRMGSKPAWKSWTGSKPAWKSLRAQNRPKKVVWAENRSLRVGWAQNRREKVPAQNRPEKDGCGQNRAQKVGWTQNRPEKVRRAQDWSAMYKVGSGRGRGF